MKPRAARAHDILIEGWGRMGPSWGISKVMAEIYALLYLSPEALSLDEISERLRTSRSNVSLNVRALVDLGVVRKVVVRGDRRDYYAAEDDIGKVARLLAVAKKRRELDPAMEIVQEAIDAVEREGGDPLVAARLEELRRHMDFVNAIFAAFVGGEGDVSELAQVVRVRDRR